MARGKSPRSARGAAISTVNLSEVVAKLVEAGMPEEAVRSVLSEIELEIRPFDLESAYQVGALRTSTRELGLSFGDHACLALGFQLGVPVLTTDRNWKSLNLSLEVRVIR